MWKAQVRNLERNKIQHVNSTAKLLKKKPALVDNISVEGWVEPGVGGEHCQRYICSLSGKKQSGDRGKKKKKNIISFGWKKDHCMEHVCHFSAKLLLLFFNEIKRASLGGASAQWAHINFLTHLDAYVCVWVPEDTSDVDIINVNSWGFWDLGKDNTKWKNTNLCFYFENLTHLTEEGLCCMRSGRHLQVLVSRISCWLLLH